MIHVHEKVLLLDAISRNDGNIDIESYSRQFPEYQGLFDIFFSTGPNKGDKDLISKNTIKETVKLPTASHAIKLKQFSNEGETYNKIASNIERLQQDWLTWFKEKLENMVNLNSTDLRILHIKEELEFYKTSNDLSNESYVNSLTKEITLLSLIITAWV